MPSSSRCRMRLHGGAVLMCASGVVFLAVGPFLVWFQRLRARTGRSRS